MEEMAALFVPEAATAWGTGDIVVTDGESIRGRGKEWAAVVGRGRHGGHANGGDKRFGTPFPGLP